MSEPTKDTNSTATNPTPTKDQATVIQPVNTKREAARVVPASANITTQSPNNDKSKKDPIFKDVPKVGFVNRAVYPVHIVFKTSDIYISPGVATTKVYNEADVVSVQKLSLSQAVSRGLISVLR